jgi:hypothetical protein
MAIATMTDVELERDTDEALRIAETMHVHVTEGGVLTHVLISAEEYRRLVAELKNAEAIR